MKRNLFLLLMTLTGIIMLNSCKKEYSCENCKGTNQPPVSKAGKDEVIALPTDSVTLNGSDSKDPDGTITSFLWTKISGPASFTVTYPDSNISKIKNLIQGAYSFELKVTDNNGLIAKDTVQVFVYPSGYSCDSTRPVVNAQLVPIGTLSAARQDLYTATAGNKILFAGGLGGQSGYDISTRVDIFDFVTNTWSTAELSQGRHGMTVATVGSKILFAGGVYQWDEEKYTRVDIYDAMANTWSTAELSEGRGYLASATLGDKVFFAGGYYWYNGHHYVDRVDIYNNTTNTWSTASLSEGREGLSATTAGNKIYFAGGSNATGLSQIIDIYDGTNGSWSTSTLNEGKQYFGSISVANKIYWAGGFNSLQPHQIPSSQVEIKDINTQVSTLCFLSQEKAAFGTVVKGNEIVFFMGAPSAQPQNFDIYNTATEKWSVGILNQGLNYPGIISVNNKIYVAGGDRSAGGGITNQVWLLQW